MHLLCATHTLAPLGALSAQIPTLPTPSTPRRPILGPLPSEAGQPNHLNDKVDSDQ